ATFLAAIDGAQRYEPGRSVTAWLVGILSKQAAHMRRQDARRPDPERLPPRPGGDPADAALDQELAEAIGHALDGLPQPYRRVLALRLVHGLSALAIARVLERSPDTVRSQLHRGFELLRRSLPRGLAPAVLFAVGASAQGLADVRAAVLGHAAGLVPGPAVSSGVAPSGVAPGVIGWTGAAIVQKKLVAVAVAVVVLAAIGIPAFVWWSGRPAAAPPEAGIATVAPPVA